MVKQMSKEIIVKLINVTKVYTSPGGIKTWALRGITLDIRRGEYLAVMGPSGHGKTTLLNIIGLLDRPTSGKVILDGIDVSKLNDSELAKLRNRKIGFVFQQYNLIGRMSVLENIELPLIVRGISRKKRIKMVKEALLKVGGELNWLNKKPTQLSGGQQQRVAIARAIVGNPELILADEPTGALDTASKKVILEVFERVNKVGHTIVLVTHDPTIAYCARYILHIKDGKIVKEEESDRSICILSEYT